MHRSLFIVPLLGCIAACQTDSPRLDAAMSQDNSVQTSIRIVPVAQVEWQALNPARGASSPRAGTLWGDRARAVPTGFLARFSEGFSSPAHIHNVTYRAVVIEGEIHNDDPQAVEQWMGPGSFWTQPRGESHITAARAKQNLALVEIDQGPYLVQPPAQAFDSGERPINVDASNLVWLPAPAQDAEGAAIAYLWGTLALGQFNGSFLRIPAGYEGRIEPTGDVFHSVVIRGELRHAAAPDPLLMPGSYFGAQEASVHQIANTSDADTVLYIRSNGPYRLHQGVRP